MPEIENNNKLFGKDFLKSWYMSDDEVKSVIETADKLKAAHKSGNYKKPFNGGLAAIITNSGKETGMELAAEFGCAVAGLSATKKEGKDFGGLPLEAALFTAGCTEVVAVRDCEYIGKSSGFMRRLAACLKDNKNGGEKPCVINLGSDEDSPVQTLSDLDILAEHFGGVDNLAGKKLAVTWAYSPSCTAPVAVPQGIISLMTRFGMNVVLAHPKGFELAQDAIDRAEENAKSSGGSFCRAESMEEAFDGADAVYAVNWAPYAFLEKRTELYEAHHAAPIEILESDLKEQCEEFKDWECTEDMMERTNSALLMHNLPAKVTDITCVRGEMTAQVYNANFAALAKQAANRGFIFGAMAFLSKGTEL